MKPLVIQEFKGLGTVKANKGLDSNAIFMSNFRNFHGQVSESHYAIKLPITGAEEYVVNRRSYRIDSNNYLLTNADQSVEAHVQSDQKVRGLCIGFSKSYLIELAGSLLQEVEEGLDNPFLKHGSISFLVKKNRLYNDSFGQALKRLKADVMENRAGNYEMEQFFMTLGELLINKELKIYSDIERLPHVKQSSKEEIYKRICLMNDYIHDCYKQDINLEELSRICALSKYHALRCYKKINKITPYKKILMLRLEEAKQLIEKGWKFSEVALETNFPDHRAFSKQFKNRFGMTPSQYRTIVT